MYEAKKLDYVSLEPYISNRTLNIHYNNHYLNYLSNLNNLLKENKYDYKYSVDELFNNLDIFNIELRDKILFNLGGVVNHELYFSNMSLENNIVPILSIKEKIDMQYGNYENFKNEFIKTANSLSGAGYTFLVINENKDLQIINMPNQENPYSYGMIPLIALDLWEHAYYLDYQNNRSEYINAFFKIIDFNKINKLYEKVK